MGATISTSPRARIGEIEAHLIVAHAGAAVGEGDDAAVLAEAQRLLDDHVAVGAEQRILPLVELRRPRRAGRPPAPRSVAAAVDGHVLGRAERARALLDVAALGLVDAAGVDEERDDVVALLAEVGDAEARVEPARERQDRFCFMASPQSPLISVSITAFCTWSRFSASSITSEPRRVDDRVGHLDVAPDRQAVREEPVRG